MSLTLNMVGGGGGEGGLPPNAAVIHVTAPVGSTISFSKGGVVAKVLGPEKSHVNSADNTLADWYYSVSSSNYGEWTMTATLDGSTASSTVTVSTNCQYDVALSYGIYLYTPGDVHTDVTGGWSATAGGSYVQFDNESLNFTDQNQFPIVSTVGTIFLASYSTLYIDIGVNSYGNSGNIYAGVADSRITADNQFAARVKKTTTGRETISLDISGYADSKYVAIAGYHSNANIYNVWLEKG